MTESFFNISSSIDSFKSSFFDSESTSGKTTTDTSRVSRSSTIFSTFLNLESSRIPSPVSIVEVSPSLSPQHPSWKQEQSSLILRQVREKIELSYHLEDVPFSQKASALKNFLNLGPDQKGVSAVIDLLFTQTEDPSFDNITRSRLQELIGDLPHQELSNPRVLDFIDRVVQNIVGVGMWDHFSSTVHEVIEHGEQLSGYSPPQKWEGMSSLLRNDFEHIELATQTQEHRFDPVNKHLEQVKGEVGIGFNPNQGSNYFSKLWEESYINSEGREIVVPVYRFGTPTQDAGLLQGKVQVTPFFEKWVDSLERSGQRHCYFGHQKRESSSPLFSHPEAKRTQALIELSDRKDSFFMFNLPMDGAFFNQTLPGCDSEELSYRQFAHALLDAASKGQHGFYFPAEKLRERGIDSRQALAECIRDVRRCFFSHLNEKRGQPLTKEERRAFILLFYSKVEQYFSVHLEASRNSTCKDAIDRAGTVNGVCYCVAQRMLPSQHPGSAWTEEGVNNARVVFHHAALFVKGQPIVPKRRDIACEAMNILDQQSPYEPDRQLYSHNGFQLVDLRNCNR